MRKAKLGVCLSLMALIALFSAAAVHADLYWENETTTVGVPQQTDGMKIQKNFFTATSARIEPGDGQIMIMDYDSMMLYNVNVVERNYTQINLREPMGLSPNLPAKDKERMGKMMGEMMQVKITPTDESKTIAGYKCRKYLVDVPMVQGVYWVSKEVKGYEELRAMGKKLAALAETNPMLKQMNIAAMVEQLDGFPVQTTNKVMGGTITSTLKRVELRRLDPELFKIPKGFTAKSQARK